MGVGGEHPRLLFHPPPDPCGLAPGCASPPGTGLGAAAPRGRPRPRGLPGTGGAEPGAGGPWLWAHGEPPGACVRQQRCWVWVSGRASRPHGELLGLGTRGWYLSRAMGVQGKFSCAVCGSSPGREPALAERCQSRGLCRPYGEAAAEVTLLHLSLQSYNLHTNCRRWLPALFLMDKRWPHGITQRCLDS